MISNPLFLDSIGGMIGLSSQGVRHFGYELSPFFCCRSEESSQELRDTKRVGICRVTSLLQSIHDRFGGLVRRRSGASGRLPPETAIVEA
ncbi:MAG: hypothetical protein WB624_15450 [Xanthobacteraceae bacterium]